jgi:phage tail P2-like protein
MSNIDTILPDSIAIYPHLVAFDMAMKRQMDKIPLQVLLVYLVDNVPAAALPLLAAQFDVLGYKGWRLATTEQDQRNLIKRAIELHRYKGTPWAVKEALKSIGFTDIELVEHVPEMHWATFRVIITNENVLLTEQSITDIISMINEYKNARSHLVDVQMKLLFEDTINLEEDEADVQFEILAEDDVTLTGALYYDGTGIYDGTYDHSGDQDVVTIT